MTAAHLYAVGAKLPWRDGMTLEVVQQIPVGSPYMPEGVTGYTVLFHGMHRVTVSQSALIRQGRAA